QAEDGIRDGHVTGQTCALPISEDYSLLPQLSWFWPGGLDFGTVIAPAVLTTIFIYWGWDTAVTCNEESDDPGRTPGRAAVISSLDRKSVLQGRRDRRGRELAGS